MATWADWKQAVEALGVIESDKIDFIDASLVSGRLSNLYEDSENRIGLVDDYASDS